MDIGIVILLLLFLSSLVVLSALLIFIKRRANLKFPKAKTDIRWNNIYFVLIAIALLISFLKPSEAHRAYIVSLSFSLFIAFLTPKTWLIRVLYMLLIVIIFSIVWILVGINILHFGVSVFIVLTILTVQLIILFKFRYTERSSDIEL